MSERAIEAANPMQKLIDAARPFAEHGWIDAEMEDDSCKLTNHSGPITVGHWRALGAALAAAQRVAGEMPPEFEALDAIINDSRYSSELIGIRVRNAWPQIKAALALSPGKVEGWREIESAPKDGTHFLACDAKTPYDKHWTFNQRPPTVVHWFQDGFYTSVNEAEPMRPFPATHWQPLDSPPISSRAEDS